MVTFVRRITAIADVFDALTTQRRYKPAFPVDEAFAVMLDERGRRFDPRLLGLFLAARPAIEDIRTRFADE